jgi:hypothetical protein
MDKNVPVQYYTITLCPRILHCLKSSHFVTAEETYNNNTVGINLLWALSAV